MSPQQFTLNIDRPRHQTMDNFVAGENGELITTLTQPSAGFRGLWIAGQRSSGKTHLLRGYCLQSAQPTTFIEAGAAADPDGDQRLMQAGSRVGDVVIDDVQELVGSEARERYLLSIYQRVFEEGSQLIVSADQPASAIGFAIADVASRMRSLEHFNIHPLNDQDKAQLLRRRADQRGYLLSEQVIHYWLTHGPRDVGQLLIDLDTLDRASLARQQRVSIPLLKEVLGY